jgi:hypothetical protein
MMKQLNYWISLKKNAAEIEVMLGQRLEVKEADIHIAFFLR